MSARHIGLIANDSKPGAHELVAALVHEFAAHPVALHLDERAARLIGEEKSETELELAEHCEMLVVLGGDGTILDALHALGNTLRPLFGINLGSLGFLTTVGANEHQRAVNAIVAHEYVLSDRTLLKVEIVRDGAVILSRSVLNDAVAAEDDEHLAVLGEFGFGLGFFLTDQSCRMRVEVQCHGVRGKFAHERGDELARTGLAVIRDQADVARRHARNSLLPSPPRMGDAMWPHHSSFTMLPSAHGDAGIFSTKSRMRATAASCSTGSRTMPPRLTSSRRSSNCGLMSGTITPS